jgi:hypothetical protein
VLVLDSLALMHDRIQSPFSLPTVTGLAGVVAMILCWWWDDDPNHATYGVSLIPDLLAGPTEELSPRDCRSAQYFAHGIRSIPPHCSFFDINRATLC